MKIIKERRLSNEQIKSIQELYKECNDHDGTQYVFDEDTDFQAELDVNTFQLCDGSKLLSTLTIFAPTRIEAEVIALTQPDQRKHGLFTSLLQCARDEVRRRGITSLLYVCDSKSVSGMQTLSHLGARYEYSEYLMRYNSGSQKRNDDTRKIGISVATEEEKNELIRIHSAAFGEDMQVSAEIINEFFSSSRREFYCVKQNDKAIGMIGVYSELDRDYIYNFSIAHKYQKKGIGKLVLQKVVDMYKTEDREIVLEVRAENSSALRVYEDVGFSIATEYQYYRDAEAPDGGAKKTASARGEDELGLDGYRRDFLGTTLY